MLDAPPLRQAARLQRVDEALPPRDLHGIGWELLLMIILLLIWAGTHYLDAERVQRV